MNDLCKTVSLPSPIPKPEVKIQGPLLIGVCGTIELSMDISTGHGGRKFSSIEWRIISPNITKFSKSLQKQGMNDNYFEIKTL